VSEVVKKKEIRVSFIIPTHNRAHLLKSLLNNIFSLKSSHIFEVVVVDNNSKDNTKEVAQSFNTSVVYVFEGNTSFTKARHTGALKAQGEFIIYLDDDVVLETNVIDEVVRLFEQYKDCAVIGGKILPQFEKEPSPWVLELQNSFNGLSLHDKGGKQADVGSIPGPFMAIRKTIYDQVGGFPPDTVGVETNKYKKSFRKLYIGPGDFGFCTKCKSAGYRIIYSPNIIIKHIIPEVRLTKSFWISRMQGEGHYIAVTRNVMKEFKISGFAKAKKILRDSGLLMKYFFKARLRRLQGSKEPMIPDELWVNYYASLINMEIILLKNPSLKKYLWNLGLEGVSDNDFDKVIQKLPKSYKKLALKMLITGGAGFIGCNAAQYFIENGWDVALLDNLSRQTATVNLAWMQKKKMNFSFINLDIRNRQGLEDYFKAHHFDVVLHLAGQVAVTTSVENPREDFEINAIGTFNILECIRNYCPEAIFINASTNKVYGNASTSIQEQEKRYWFKDVAFQGISEKQSLDFYSPYGCSKGIADQYTLDYARCFNVKSVSVRQSCIYGPHQFGIEDQGWVAWFIIAVLLKKPLTIYGNGKQVRDVLHVKDLIRFYDLLIKNIDTARGLAFNMGGGIQNAISLLQFLDILTSLTGKKIEYQFGDWRPGDQYIFVSDNTRAEQLLGFKPEISFLDGIEKIYSWLAHYYKERPEVNKKTTTQRISA